MAQNFRTAFRGFNQEDVVNYLEFMNNQYTIRVEQIAAEIDYLRKQVEGTGPSYDEYTALTAELETATRSVSDLLADNEQLRLENEMLKEKLSAESPDERAETIQELKSENLKLKKALYRVLKQNHLNGNITDISDKTT